MAAEYFRTLSLVFPYPYRGLSKLEERRGDKFVSVNQNNESSQARNAVQMNSR